VADRGAKVIGVESTVRTTVRLATIGSTTVYITIPGACTWKALTLLALKGLRGRL
jgi:hypothetical protein